MGCSSTLKRVSFLFGLVLVPTLAHALFFIPDDLRFAALPLPDVSSFTEVSIRQAWKSRLQNSRVEGSLDPEVLLSLNLEALAAWNKLAACNGGSPGAAREAYRQGKLCANFKQTNAVKSALEQLHRSVDQALQSSEIRAVTLPVYAGTTRSALSLPVMHPFFLQMLLERIAYAVHEDGRQQLVAVPGDSRTLPQAQPGTVLVKAAPGKQAVLHALVILMESPPDCMARGVWPGLEQPLFDAFRERMSGLEVYGFHGAMLLYYRECRFSAFTKSSDPVSATDGEPPGLWNFTSDLSSHYLFNQGRYVRKLAALWSRYL